VLGLWLRGLAGVWAKTGATVGSGLAIAKQSDPINVKPAMLPKRNQNLDKRSKAKGDDI
jgi:hypothetical protein